MIKFDFKTFMQQYISDEEINAYLLKKDIIVEKLKKSEMNGWLNVSNSTSPNDLILLKQKAEYIRKNADVFIVIGIGGSYMGSCALYNIFKPYFKNNEPEIIYAGNSLSGKYIKELLEYIDDKKVVINIVSKSGGTLETRIAYNKIFELMSNKYNRDELKERIIITTDESNNLLRQESLKKGFQIFSIPTNIGGRYSAFTPATLLSLQVANLDIDALIKGAKLLENNYDLAYKYAVIRNILFQKKKYVEGFVIYEPSFYYFTEWLNQLFAESEGKDKKGILPISLVNSRDLHSIGQFLQEGNDIIFETVINIINEENIEVNKEYTMDQLNNLLLKSVAKAHFDGHTPSNIITIDKVNEENIGTLIYFFMISAALSSLLFDVNPFNQPGVEKYKENIKNIL